MGACCTRQNLSKDTILDYTSVFNSNREEKNKENDEWNLNYESNIFDSNSFNNNLNNLIIFSNENFDVKIKKISFIEIYNITLLYQENYTNSKYLLYDLRPTNKQLENCLKKMKRINYLQEEIRLMSLNKKNNFKRYLNNHIIIIIFPSNSFENKKIEESKELISNLLNLKIDININFLNTCFEENSLSPFSQKLNEFLDNRYYGLLPHILLTYSHILNCKNEGFIFIKFNSNIFSFENFCKEKEEQIENKDNIINDFIKEFKITTIINIDNEEINKYNFKQFQDKNIIYKECDIGWNEYENKKVNIEIIGKWIKGEIKIGHSVILNIHNYKENNDNWILVVLLFLVLSISTKISQIINYLNEKIIFISDFKLKIDENQSKLNNILKNYGVISDIGN